MSVIPYHTSSKEACDVPARACRSTHADHVFGVPVFVFRGELFWGQDRMGWLVERLAEAGLGVR